MKPVYLDYAATTPMAKEVRIAMQEAERDFIGNPSSVHSFGHEARAAIRKARLEIAELIDADPEDIFFTSGGTESDNTIVKGIFFDRKSKGLSCHIVTSSIEHSAVLEACSFCKGLGADITLVPVDAEGVVEKEAFSAALREDTALASIMLANNEVGTIEPIRELSDLCRERNIPFHTDAVQAVGHIPVSVQELGVDALSFSGHKLYGPKGIGVLYLRRGVSVSPLLWGGGQERGMRSGTENVPAIVGLGEAARLSRQKMQQEMAQLKELQDYLQASVLSLDGAFENGARKRLPGNFNFGIHGISAEELLMRLDIEGVAVSAGSACSSGAIEPSHVLLAMGRTSEEVRSSIRVSMGRFTTKDEIKAFADTLRNIVQELRL